MLIHEVDSESTKFQLFFAKLNWFPYRITLSLFFTSSNFMSSTRGHLYAFQPHWKPSKWIMESLIKCGPLSDMDSFFNSSSCRGYQMIPLSLFSEKTVQRPDIYLAGGLKPVLFFPLLWGRFPIWQTSDELKAPTAATVPQLVSWGHRWLGLGTLTSMVRRLKQSVSGETWWNYNKLNCFLERLDCYNTWLFVHDCRGTIAGYCCASQSRWCARA